MISSNGLSVDYLMSGKGDTGAGRSSSRQEGNERTVSYGRKVMPAVLCSPETNNDIK